MGVAGRKAKAGRAKHKPLLTLAYPKIGPSAVMFSKVCTSNILLANTQSLKWQVCLINESVLVPFRWFRPFRGNIFKTKRKQSRGDFFLVSLTEI